MRFTSTWNWNLEVLVFMEWGKPENPEKNPRNKDENQQQTQPSIIDSIITYSESQNIPGILLFINFEKAFDTLEWDFIERTLRYYNFGNSLIAWVKLFYTDINSCIQNNGWSSDFFSLTRGVRQGCPPSPYLFMLCVEILGNAIRNHDIKVFVSWVQNAN